MPQDRHLVELDALLRERREGDQGVGREGGPEGLGEDAVVLGRQLDAGEQVRDDALEQEDVVCEELGQVRVPEGLGMGTGLGVRPRDGDRARGEA